MDSLIKVKLYHISCLLCVLDDRCCQIKIIALDKSFYIFAIMLSPRCLENNRLMHPPRTDRVPAFYFPELPLPFSRGMNFAFVHLSGTSYTFSADSHHFRGAHSTASVMPPNSSPPWSLLPLSTCAFRLLVGRRHYITFIHLESWLIPGTEFERGLCDHVIKENVPDS